MLTFLELYQTLLGFVMYKLYTDENLVYPPQLDLEKDDAGAGVGAITLSERSADVLQGKNIGATAAAEGAGEQAESAANEARTADGKRISAKDVKKQIKAISKNGVQASASGAEEQDDAADAEDANAELGSSSGAVDGFVEQGAAKKAAAAESSTTASTSAQDSQLKTLSDLEAASSSDSSACNIFAPYYFYISRECPRSLLEFVLRCFGAAPERIGWDMVAGAGSAIAEDDPRITHHFVDRPVGSSSANQYDGSRHPGSKRVYVQPQWLIDSANARKLLPTEPFAPGQTLPPHLSPFVNEEEVRRRGGYVPTEAAGTASAAAAVEEEDDDEEEEDEEMQDDDEEDAEEEDATATRPALKALLQKPSDAALLEAAELEAEAIGGEEEVERVRKLSKGSKSSSGKTAAKAAQPGSAAAEQAEEKEAKEMARMLLSNRQRKLYNKISHSQGVKGEEKRKLEEKKRLLVKAEKKQGKGR